jgi:hypothetical protein
VFVDEAITVHMGAQVTAVRRDGDQVTVSVRASDGRDVELSVERLLMATGRRPCGVPVQCHGCDQGRHHVAGWLSWWFVRWRS